MHFKMISGMEPGSHLPEPLHPALFLYPDSSLIHASLTFIFERPVRAARKAEQLLSDLLEALS